MSKYIYEMVTFRSWEDANPEHFYVEYHFEDYFTSRKAAISFMRSYIEWLRKKKMAVETTELNLKDRFNNQHVLYLVQNEEVTEFYGIVRNIILN